MEKHRLTLIVLAAAFSGAAFAQSEGGLIVSAGAEKGITKQLSFGVEAEMRTRNDFKTMDRWSFGLGAEYKFNKWLKADAGYDFLHSNFREKITYTDAGAYNHWRPSYWGNRHRWHASLTGTYKWDCGVKVSLRERWQYTYRPEKTVDRYWNYTDEDDDAVYGEPVIKKGTTQTHTYQAKGSNKWRQRLQLKYKLTKQWRPYLSAESTVGANGLDKMRYSLGTEIRLTKQHSLDVKYLFQHSYKDDDNEGDRHVLGIGYTIKF